ncbi:unnamed protein product [Cyprideis torosa]|uniref:Uncharacterized protein n=1 Tax=Cyprideis torosa TaxID=163714 RepID=A0A7R8ZVK6_9CRUS|nr:unnamed protein product [Cyprideis torosa]CAG0910364.1 unnamed protein product [Cyprideis torosa]
MPRHQHADRPTPRARNNNLTRQARGAQAYRAGLSAESSVAQDYERRGYAIVHQRWRGQGGEIDLIVRDGDGLIFVEVKQSRSFDRAAQSLGARQVERLQTAAEEYSALLPTGSLTDFRFDVALVNQRGEIRILTNAIIS